MSGRKKSRCNVHNCARNPNVSLHSLPIKLYMRESWLKRLRLCFLTSQRLLVCGEHFCRSDFMDSGKKDRQRLRLFPYAVPSINLPTHEFCLKHEICLKKYQLMMESSVTGVQSNSTGDCNLSSEHETTKELSDEERLESDEELPTEINLSCNVQVMLEYEDEHFSARQVRVFCVSELSKGKRMTIWKKNVETPLAVIKEEKDPLEIDSNDCLEYSDRKPTQLELEEATLTYIKTEQCEPSTDKYLIKQEIKSFENLSRRLKCNGRMMKQSQFHPPHNEYNDLINVLEGFLPQGALSVTSSLSSASEIGELIVLLCRNLIVKNRIAGLRAAIERFDLTSMFDPELSDVSMDSPHAAPSLSSD